MFILFYIYIGRTIQVQTGV